MKTGRKLLYHHLKDSSSEETFSLQRKWGLLWGSLILLSQCTVQSPPQIIVLHDGEILTKPGDTLSSLAHEYNTTPRALVETNHLRPPFFIESHQKLRLPEKEPNRDWDYRNIEEPLLEEPLPPPLPRAEIAMRELPEETLNFEEDDNQGPVLMPKEKIDVQWVDINLDDIGAKKKPSSPKPLVTEKKGSLLAPAFGKIVSRHNDNWKGIKSYGLHYKVPNKKVFSVAQGTVLHVGPCYDKIYDQSSGKRLVVLIQHPDKMISAYGPFETCFVRAKQKVSTKTLLGKLQGDILFFHMRKNQGKKRQIINPEPLLSAR